MNVSRRHDTALFAVDRSLRSHNGDGRTAGRISGLFRDIDSQFSRVCAADLHLGGFSDRSQNPTFSIARSFRPTIVQHSLEANCPP